MAAAVVHCYQFRQDKKRRETELVTQQIITAYRSAYQRLGTLALATSKTVNLAGWAPEGGGSSATMPCQGVPKLRPLQITEVKNVTPQLRQAVKAFRENLDAVTSVFHKLDASVRSINARRDRH